jgi:PAS domain S-box-containing protein
MLGAALIAGWHWWQWTFNLTQVADFSELPMAQSTATLTLLLVAGTLGLRAGRLVRLSQGVLWGVAALALVFAWQNRSGLGESLEHAFWPDETHVWMRDGQRAGHISPFTGVGLAVVAIVWCLASTAGWTKHAGLRVAGWLAATAVIFYSLFLIGVHLVGTPLLHDWTSAAVTLGDLATLALLSISTLAHTRAVRGVSDSVLAGELSEEARRRLVRDRNASAVVVALAFAVIAAASFVWLRREQVNAREVMAGQLKMIADSKVQEINAWLGERRADAIQLGGAPSLGRLAAGDESVRDDAAQWLRRIVQAYRYYSASVLDLEGRTIFATREGERINLHEQGVLLERVRHVGAPLFGPLHRPANGSPQMDLATVLRDANSRAVGFVVLRINPQVHLYPLLASWPLNNLPGEAVLVRRDGEFVQYLSPVGGRVEDALRMRAPLSDPRLMAARALRGETGFIEGASYIGRPSAASSVWVPGTDWLLGVRVDLSAAYAGTKQSALLVGLGLSMSFLGLCLAGMVHWRRRVHTFWAQQAGLEREHRRATERLSHVMRAAGDAILLLDGKGRVIEANEAAARIYLYPLETMVGQIADKLCGGVIAALGAQADAGPVVRLVASERSDGTSFLAEMAVQSVQIDGVEYRLVTVRDVTEREAQAEQLRRVTRLYSALSQVNETIAREREPAAMLGEVARILTDTGGFRCVWIGRHDAANRRIVREEAAGQVTEFFRNLEVSVADPTSSLFTIDRAFNTGAPCVVQDFFGAHELAIGSKAAAEAGVRSAATLPLRQGGKLWGVLAVYAEQAGMFGVEEVALLEKVAADVSFALETSAAEEERKLLAAAINSSNTSVVITDASGRITWVNPSFTTMTGYTAEEAIGRNPRLLKSGQQPPEFYEQMWSQLANGRGWRGRFINRRKDGTLFTEDAAIAPVFGADGRVTHYVAMKIDISAQLQAEAEAGDQRQRLQTLLEVTTESVAFADPQTGEFVEFNTRAHEALGYTREEFSRMNIGMIDAAQSPEDIRRHVGLMLRPQGHSVETRHRTKSGELRDVIVRARPVQLLGRTLLSASWADITEARERERQVQAANIRLEEAQRMAHLGSWETDMRTKRSRWSKECFRIAGIEPQPEVDLQRFFDFVHPDDRERVKTDYWQSVKQRGAFACDYRLVTKQGTIRFVQLRGEHEFDANGELLRSMGTLQDMTEKKQLQDELMRAQRLESIGMLAAGIAHDLNNVLAPILMAAPILRMRSPGDEKNRSLLRTLEKSAERGAGLVKQILSFAHGLSGQLQIVQAKHILRDIASVARETFPKLIEVREEVPADLWPITGHPSQVHQIVLNLAVNARDAMPTGGVLTIKGENVTLSDAAAAAIPGAKAGEWLVLHVEDTGTGIPAEVLERMWEAFYTTKGPGRGTGLGLATVRRIVEDHRGFIEVRTVVGHGTTFRIYLPIDRSAAKAEAAEETQAFFGHEELILMVDDEETIREMAKIVLTDHNYRVITARDGAEAVALYSKHAQEISLVITDLDMPNLDGGGLARVIRHLNPNVRIIAISGLESSSATTKVRPEEFATAFLPKPFKHENLLNLVHHVLNGSPNSPLPQ